MPTGKLKCVIENGEPVLYCEFDGRRIARRLPGENWVSLERGCKVRGSEPGGNYKTLEVVFSPTSAEPQ